MNMEDETPAPAPVAAAPVEPAPPPVVEAPADPDEVGAIEVQGGKHVPLEALKASRAETRAAKEQAARLPQLEQQIAQMQGSLQTFQQLQQTLQRPPAPPANADTDPDLIELARSLDYYQGDGTPDVARASKHREINRRDAQRQLQQMIQPLQQENARTRSVANYHAAVAMQGPQGQKPNVATLNWMWQNLPPEYTADPRVAQALPALALGLEQFQGNGSRLPANPPPPANPPLHTEGIAGSPAARRVAITEAERDVINARGMKEETYLKHTKDYKPGRATQLED